MQPPAHAPTCDKDRNRSKPASRAFSADTLLAIVWLIRGDGLVCYGSDFAVRHFPGERQDWVESGHYATDFGSRFAELFVITTGGEARRGYRGRPLL